MPLASMTTGAAATSRCVRKYTAAATQNSIMQTKNTRRPSRSRSRHARSTRRGRNATYGYDDYREDLRKALEIYEELVETSIRVHGEDHAMTESLLELLWESRNEQLDWSIDDLTPETRLAYHYSGQYEYSADSEEDADAADAAEVLAIL